LKLLLDEMYPSLIARELRARGHDVVSVHESPGSGTLDEQVLDHARAEGRAVVTENVRDYRPLAEALLVAGESHAGLVFTTEKRWPRRDPGALITALEAMLASTPGQPIDTELWL
jgi:predicted nuclease of predicted toxin-antitoxin system